MRRRVKLLNSVSGRIKCVGLFLILSLLATAVYYRQIPDDNPDYVDFTEKDKVPPDCNIPALVSEIQTSISWNTSDQEELLPICVNDTSMFRIDHGSELVKLELEDSFWTVANCCYNNLWRISSEPDFNIVENSKCYKISSPITRIPVHQDFLKITCFYKNTSKIIYQDQLAHVRVWESSRIIEEMEAKKGNKLSVMIFGMQDMSRMNFIHMLPKTNKFLMEKLNAFEFQGFNSIGQGPIQNIIPLLSGKLFKTFYSECSSHDKYFLDTCPFAWKNYHSEGYHTSFQEEHAAQSLLSIGSRYYREGFSKAHFTFDFRVLNRGLEWIKLGHENKTQNLNGKVRSAKLIAYDDKQCYGARRSLKSLANNFALTAQTYKSKLVFHLTWSTTVKNNVDSSDTILKEMLQKIANAGSLNNMALIFVSDNGEAQNNFQNPGQEFAQARLPILYIVLPPKFLEKYKLAARNLKYNSNKLVSSLDVSRFISDLTQENSTLEVAAIKNRSAQFYFENTGISLFLPIPPARTCYHAGISDLYCSCLSRSRINSNSSEIKRLANFAIKELNVKLVRYSVCARLKLKNVVNAHVLRRDSGGKNTTMFSISKSFLISFTTQHLGKVLWEAAVRSTLGSLDFIDARRVRTDDNVNICITNREEFPTCVCK